MIKIVRIIARLNIGGPAIHTVLLSSELSKRGYSDKLICGRISTSEGDMSYLANKAGISPVVIPELKREISLKDDWRAFLAIYSIIKKERPDIVHTHTAKAGTIGRLAAFFAGVPIKVHTFHGHVFDGYFSPLKASIFLCIERILAIFTTRLVTVSESVKDEIVGKLKVCSKDKCVVIPLGLDLDPFFSCEDKRDSFRKEFGISKDVILVGIVGRLVPIKNHIMFIDAAKRVADDVGYDRVRFFIIGDGEMRSVLEEHVSKLGVGSLISFIGWRQDLNRVYSGLDIVTLTSLNEGTPVSLIEAMASARPIVATDVGGVRDVVADEKSGYIVASGDVEQFSKKIEALIHDAEKRPLLGAQGRVLAKKFAKERLINDVDEMYKGLLKNVH